MGLRALFKSCMCLNVHGLLLLVGPGQSQITFNTYRKCHSGVNIRDVWTKCVFKVVSLWPCPFLYTLFRLLAPCSENQGLMLFTKETSLRAFHISGQGKNLNRIDFVNVLSAKVRFTVCTSKRLIRNFNDVQLKRWLHLCTWWVCWFLSPFFMIEANTYIFLKPLQTPPVCYRLFSGPSLKTVLILCSGRVITQFFQHVSISSISSLDGVLSDNICPSCIIYNNSRVMFMQLRSYKTTLNANGIVFTCAVINSLPTATALKHPQLRFSRVPTHYAC